MKAIHIYAVFTILCSTLVVVNCLPTNQQPFPNEQTDHKRLEQFEFTYRVLCHPLSESTPDDRKTLVQKIKDLTGKRQNNPSNIQSTFISKERKR